MLTICYEAMDAPRDWVASFHTINVTVSLPVFRRWTERVSNFPIPSLVSKWSGPGVCLL